MVDKPVEDEQQAAQAEVEQVVQTAVEVQPTEEPDISAILRKGKFKTERVLQVKAIPPRLRIGRGREND